MEEIINIPIVEQNNDTTIQAALNNSIARYSDFSRILKENNINIKDKQNFEIKKSGGNFIFIINDKPTFSITSRHLLNKFITKFVEEGKNEDQEVVVHFSNIKGEELKISIGTQQQLSNLKNEVNTAIEQAQDPKIIQNKINTLSKEYTKLITEAEKNSKLFNNDARRNKQERFLRNIQETLAEMQNKDIGFVQKNLDKAKGESDPRLRYLQISENLDKKFDIMSKMRTQSENITRGIANIMPYYDIINTRNISKSEANDLGKQVKKYIKVQSKVSEKTKDFDQKILRAQDLVEFQEYLENVGNGGIDPAKTPFSPGRQASYTALGQADTDQYPTGTNPNPNQARGGQNPGTGNQNRGAMSPNAPGSAGELSPEEEQQQYNSFNEAVDKNGIYGGIDYLSKDIQDTSPRGQAFYKSFGNIALVAGGVFLGAKVIKSLWRVVTGKADGTQNERAWLLGTSGLLLATAGRPQDIFKGGYASEKMADFFNRVGLGNNGDTSMETTPQAVVGAMMIFNGQTYGTMKAMLKEDNGKMKIDGKKYDQMLSETTAIIDDATATTEAKEKAEMQKEFLKSIGKEDKNNFVDHAMRSVGIEWKDLSNNDNKDLAFDKMAAGTIQRITEITGKMGNGNNPYESTNPEMDTHIQNYIRNGTPSLEDLENMGAFEKKIDVNIIPQATQTKLTTMVKELTITPDVKKNQILQGLYQFYIDRPTDDTIKAGLEIKKDGNNIKLTTYGQTTTIDLTNKKVPGLKKAGDAYDIEFASTKELLKVASLTNRLKQITKTQSVGGNEPFSETIRGNLSFNNTERYELRKLDTNTASSDSIKKISPTLAKDENKEQYAKYLNNRWKNKPNNTPPA